MDDGFTMEIENMVVKDGRIVEVYCPYCSNGDYFDFEYKIGLVEEFKCLSCGKKSYLKIK